MPSRISPYVFGMWAAYLYSKDKLHNYQTNENIIFEWISFIVIITISIIGVYPTQFSSWSPLPHFMFLVSCRQLFGASIAYLIHLMLSPKPETPIKWYRPTCFLRWLLSKKLWVPLATVSYSFYVFHI